MVGETDEVFEHDVDPPEALATDSDEVIGCVYIDPDDSGAADATIRCWVQASRADRDADLAAAIDQWLRDAWPAHSRRWPGRPSLGS